MARSDSPDEAPDEDGALAAVVRRLGTMERQLDQVVTRLAALESSVEDMATSLNTHLPRVQREAVATSAMVDAVAAQVAADTDSIMRRLDRLAPPGGASAGGGFWRWLRGGEEDSSGRG